MRAQVAEYGSFSESSATALGKSFEPNKNLFGSRFQVESGAQSASSSVSADEVLATTAPDTTHKVIEVLAPPLVQWTDVDHFEIVMMSSLQASASTCSDSKPRSIVSGTSVTSAKTDGGDNGSTDQPNGSSPVSDYSQYKYTCRYCHEEFLGIQPTSAAPLKDHILYACSTIPRERLSRLVESELLAPV